MKNIKGNIKGKTVISRGSGGTTQKRIIIQSNTHSPGTQISQNKNQSSALRNIKKNEGYLDEDLEDPELYEIYKRFVERQSKLYKVPIIAAKDLSTKGTIETKNIKGKQGKKNLENVGGNLRGQEEKNNGKTNTITATSNVKENKAKIIPLNMNKNIGIRNKSANTKENKDYRLQRKTLTRGGKYNNISTTFIVYSNQNLDVEDIARRSCFWGEDQEIEKSKTTTFKSPQYRKVPITLTKSENNSQNDIFKTVQPKNIRPTTTNNISVQNRLMSKPPVKYGNNVNRRSTNQYQGGKNYGKK